MISSLPLRATLAAALALIVMASVLILAIGWQSSRALSGRTLAEIADDAADLVAVYTHGGPDALNRRIDERLAHNDGGGRILHLTSADGRAIAGSFVGGGTAALDDIASSPVFTYRPALASRSRLAAGHMVELASPPMRLLVARDIEAERALAFRIQMLALGGLGTLAAAALAFGLYARHLLLARIATITTTAQAIMDGDLGQRIPRDRSGDEIDALAMRLNEMLERIDNLMQALRDVSDNIAHDLKTPINRLRNTAEAALSRPAAVRVGDAQRAIPDRGGDEAYRSALGAVIEQADSIIQTFNALLQVARLEQGTADLPLGELDVGALVSDVADLYAPVAEDTGLSIDVAAAPSTMLRGNRQLLGQALANLIDNAIKYSSGHAGVGGSVISVSLAAAPDGIVISVADRGPGIAAEDREQALKRFGRLDKSRSLPGTGLGLSLVAAIARLHGGTLRLEDNAPGLRAVLSLPRAAPQSSRRTA